MIASSPLPAVTAPRHWRAGSPLVDALLDEARIVARRGGLRTAEALTGRLWERHRAAIARELAPSTGSGQAAVDAAALLDVWRTGDHASARYAALLSAAERAFELAPLPSLRLHPTWGAALAVMATDGPALEAFWRAEYRVTQAWLRKHRISSARLWRGVAVPCVPSPELVERAVELWPVSSWAMSLPAARAFALLRGHELGVSSELWYAEVPAARILSLGLAWADTNAGEVLVLGGAAEAWSLRVSQAEDLDERAVARLLKRAAP